MKIATRHRVRILGVLIAAALPVTGLAQDEGFTDEEIRAQTERIQREIREMRDVADKKKAIQAEAQRIRDQILFIDDCLAKPGHVIMDAWGCAPTKESVSLLITRQVMSGETKLDEVAEEFRRLGGRIAWLRERMRASRESFRKDLEDVNRRLADVHAPGTTHAPDSTPKSTPEPAPAAPKVYAPDGPWFCCEYDHPLTKRACGVMQSRAECRDRPGGAVHENMNCNGRSLRCEK